MRRRVLPYRLPQPDVVDAEDWMMLLEDTEVPAPSALDNWDYNMDLRLRRSMRVGLGALRSTAGLGPDVPIAASVVWTATGSNLRGMADRVLLMGADVETFDLTAGLRGSQLGGTLILETVIALAETHVPKEPLVAHRAGSALWSQQSTLRLQGDAAGLPMSVVAFANTSFPDEAAWHLQIGPDLQAAAMGTLLLLINEQNSVTATAFKNAGNPRQVDRVVMSAVYADVARVMIEHALNHSDFTAETNFPEGSLGAVLRALFERMFPGQSIRDLELRREQSPAFFDSDVQAAVRIFAEA